MSSVKDMIRAARLPERTVGVCLRADLAVEYERIQRELDEAHTQAGTSLAGSGGTAVELEAQLTELRDQMGGHTLTMTLRALPRPDFRALVEAHPPRRTADGEIDERDKYAGINKATFYPVLIRACTAAPDLDDDDWRILLDERVTDRQFQDLFDVAWLLNRGEVDVPFSPAVSAPTPS